MSLEAYKIKHICVVSFALSSGKLFAFSCQHCTRLCSAIKVWFLDYYEHVDVYGTCETSLINYMWDKFYDCNLENTLAKCGHLIYECLERLTKKFSCLSQDFKFKVKEKLFK